MGKGTMILLSSHSPGLPGSRNEGSPARTAEGLESHERREAGLPPDELPREQGFPFRGVGDK